MDGQLEDERHGQSPRDDVRVACSVDSDGHDGYRYLNAVLVAIGTSSLNLGGRASESSSVTVPAHRRAD